MRAIGSDPAYQVAPLGSPRAAGFGECCREDWQQPELRRDARLATDRQESYNVARDRHDGDMDLALEQIGIDGRESLVVSEPPLLGCKALSAHYSLVCEALLWA